MKPWALLLLSGLLAVATVLASAVEARDTRFSQSLTVSERTAAGLNHLSSDQIAVLDALFRRDAAAQSAPRRADAPSVPARFSERLTLNEHLTAGLTALTDDELAQLNALAARSSAVALKSNVSGGGGGGAGMSSQSTYVPLSVRARVAEAAPAPEIHGSFTIGMGFGKGYSERFGGMTLTYDDPAHNLAVSFSYSESRVKGRAPYCLRDPLLDEDRFSRFEP